MRKRGRGREREREGSGEWEPLEIEKYERKGDGVERGRDQESGNLWR